MARLYGVLAGCTTLREMEAGLAVATGKLLRLHLFNYIALPELLRLYEQKRYKRLKKNPPYPTCSVQPDTLLFDSSFG
jgi:hypothetical protein